MLVSSLLVHSILIIFGAPIARYVLPPLHLQSIAYFKVLVATSQVAKTYLLSLLFSVLAVFPPAYALGAPSSLTSKSPAALVTKFTWTRVFAEMSCVFQSPCHNNSSHEVYRAARMRNSAERALLYPALGATIGCWVGIFPVALDWDRPWQAWPLTPAYGIVAGYILGSLAALTVTATLHLASQGQRIYQQEQQVQAQDDKTKPKRVA